ncbi:MAG: hypothetical protein PWQ97_1503, partial [Tepidanaerobacteraceae bacterium]|nr:hypothetical protein [Tepidanaerobacteraceae bacterium]
GYSHDVHLAGQFKFNNNSRKTIKILQVVAGKSESYYEGFKRIKNFL